jgi:hypothetical protein
VASKDYQGGWTVSERLDAFLDEYEALCLKHHLMVLSEGEQVWVEEASENLWGIRRSTSELSLVDRESTDE